jgi:hypothetical protein
MVWKERNKRIFEQSGLSPIALARQIQDTIAIQYLAMDSATES